MIDMELAEYKISVILSDAGYCPAWYFVEEAAVKLADFRQRGDDAQTITSAYEDVRFGDAKSWTYVMDIGFIRAVVAQGEKLCPCSRVTDTARKIAEVLS